MIKVAFTDFVFENRDEIRLEGCEFEIHPPLRTADEIVAAAAGADVLCMRDQFGKVSREALERLPDLKLIVTRSVGYDHVDLAEAKRRGVVVCNVPDYGAHMIAEHAFGLLLAVARHVVTGHNRYVQERVFSDRGLQGIELHGKCLGIVGTGRIGLHSVRIAKGFGMEVLAYDVAPNPEAAQTMGFRYAPLEELMVASDAVSLHVVLNDATRHLIDAERLALMKRGAILVNTSRGGVVDTQALTAALRSGHLAGAGLDVLENERDTYHDLSGLNVVVTPHVGWYTDGAVRRILQATLDNIAAFKRGEATNRLA
ncbi:MAG TPA: NAD(P)-dependent oxidoreductase [Anaerolineae bacterium]|nr:NAD(P)-dependent oxidoreductase [Anaerolineae bacterium]